MIKCPKLIGPENRALSYEPINVNNYVYSSDPVGDNTNAVLRAIDLSLTNGNGQPIYFPSGDHCIDTAQYDAAVKYQNVEKLAFIGDSYLSTRITFKADNEQKTLFAFIDCDDVLFKGITFDGRCTTGINVPYNTAIDCRGVKRFTLTECRGMRFGNRGVRVGATGVGGSDLIADGTRQSESVTITNNRFEDQYGSAAVTTKSGGGSKINVSGNQFERMPIAAISIESEQVGGATTEPSESIVISSNIIKDVNGLTRAGSNSTFAISLAELAQNTSVTGNVVTEVSGPSGGIVAVSTSPTQSDTPIESINVTGNVLHGSVTGSVYIANGLESVRKVNVGNNNLKGFRGVWIVNQGGEMSEFNINGNVIEATDTGIASANASGPPLTDSIISGNTINAGNNGIDVLIADSSITGNMARGSGFVGIRTKPGSFGTDVDRNTLRGFTTDTVYNGNTSNFIQ